MKNIDKHIISLFLLIFNSCSTINSGLKAGPIQNSPFAERALLEGSAQVVAAPERNYPFHRVWRAESDVLEPGLELPVYVAEVDMTQLHLNGSPKHGPRSQETAVLGEYLRNRLKAELRRASYHVVDERPVVGRVIELALVEASTTDVARNVLGTALSAIVPGGGLLSVHSSGSTAVEGVVRDAATNKPLFIFADRERGKTAPFSFNDFTPYSHAREAIDDWAEQIVKACALPSGEKLEDSFALTLLPL